MDKLQKSVEDELIIANKELAFQNEEKRKRAVELGIANIELAFQNEEKEKRAAELVIANKELAFQDEEKGKRAAELGIAIIELAFQDDEKEKRAKELIIANKELAFQNDEKEKRANELIIANKELLFQNAEKDKRAAELITANKELIQSEKLLKNSLKETSDYKEALDVTTIIAITDQKGIIKKANSNFCKISKYTEDELIGQDHRIINSGYHPKEFMYDLWATISIGKIWKGEIKNKAKDGTFYWVDTTIVPFLNEDGKPYQYLAIRVDTSKRRESEEQLKIVNKELAFQNDEKEKRANELVIANKELAFQNDEKEKRANELVIANKELAFQNDEKEKRANELIIANKELAFQNDEKEKRANELIIANKELAFQNVEKAKRAAELGIANYARSLIEASLDPLFTINTEGKIMDMNNASINVLGKSRQELIDTDFFDYFTEPKKAREGYQEVFAKGFVADYPLTIKDHKLTDVLFNGSIYKDEDGNVLGVVVVARDITEQKIFEKELTEAKIFAELATTIAEDAQGKAEAAMRIAEDAVKAKQQFLSNMSHEIRTPMNAIIGFTKVVLKTDLTAKQKEYLTAIKMSGDALIVLINDILDLAKVDAGKMTFEQTPFKMAMSIAAMLHLFETKIQEKNLELVKEYDINIPEVLIGDSVRLHQIILNLVSNAVKFTSEGKITASVRLQSEDDESVLLEFAISDTGIGISENKLDKIFENFQQASSGTSRLFGGTGLGLAIVKQLVESQGGKTSVKSKIDKGSTFSFTLSFKKTKEAAEIENDLVEVNREIKNIKVLVVEDIALNQLLMKTLLDDFGFERDIASNGKIAIEKLQTKAYDIILMDLQMPEMNGFEATTHIRNIMKSTIPIIALTADVTTVDLAKCKAVGMNDYIAKPVDERVLYSKIIGLMKKTSTIRLDENIVNQNKKVKCIDLEYLMHRTKSNPELMMEMISLYLEQTPPLIKAMKDSFDKKDWQTLYAAVHKMIPSFSIVGIHTDFEIMAKKIQEFANTQIFTEGIQELVTQLETVCTQACKELEEELNRIKSTGK